MISDNKYVYFLYSEEQIKEKNQIMKKTGKTFVPGTVVVNGTRKKFTQLSTDSKLDRFIDTVLVAEGYEKSFVFTRPTSVKEGRSTK